MTRGLFITGTGTEVGKTYVASLIARHLAADGGQVGVYKPAASGCRLIEGQVVADDAVQLWEAAGRPGELANVCPQRFLAPLAPHLAAQVEGKRVDTGLLRAGLDYWQERSDVVVVEGAGGLMSPIGEQDYNADLVAEFGFPLVVVTANVLGTINATLQTLIAAETYCDGLDVAGVVLNNLRGGAGEGTSDGGEVDVSRSSNRAELTVRCVAPLLAEVAYGATDFDSEVDWLALASATR